MALGKSQTLKVTLTQPNITKLVAVFGFKNVDETLLKFHEPPRDDYQQMVKDGDNYTMVLTEEATAHARSGLLVLDVKGWFADNSTIVKRFVFTNLADNYVAEIQQE